jgi:hypothetical protein
MGRSAEPRAVGEVLRERSKRVSACETAMTAFLSRAAWDDVRELMTWSPQPLDEPVLAATHDPGALMMNPPIRVRRTRGWNA